MIQSLAAVMLLFGTFLCSKNGTKVGPVLAIIGAGMGLVFWLAQGSGFGLYNLTGAAGHWRSG